MEEGLISSSQLAKILGVHPRTLYRWLPLGLPRYQAHEGGCYRFDPTQVISWLSLQSRQVNRKVQKINKLRSIH
jgi:phage terminase Nu1 subunit (DNA packaging protein)